MNHTVEQLIVLAQSYHAQDDARTEAQGGEQPEELRRRAAHVQACASFGEWIAMLRRLEGRFPGQRIDNRSLFRQSPTTSVYDLAYSGALHVPVRGADESYRYIGFMASIVVPYYVVYDLARLASGDVYWRIGFDLAEDQEVTSELRRALEATFSGYSPMPQDVGQAIVPGVRTSVKRPGEATVFDCLFSDDW